jgi:hypothetical protein
MKSKPFKILNYFMLVVYLYMVVVQYNDPDTLLWVSIYGIAAIICFLASRDRLHWGISAIMAGVALVWALTLAPDVIGKVSFSELFGNLYMKTLAIEQAREMGGLLIVAGWMIVLTLSVRRQEMINDKK